MTEGEPWIKQLSREDLNFLKEFVLASGSLKELAKLYGISYPTVRLRLDRLIKLVKEFSQDHELSPLERELQNLVIKGELSSNNANKILQSHKKTINK